MPSIRGSAIAAAWLLCAGCGTATGPAPSPVSEITLTCPADIRLPNIGTPTALVPYPAPTATGGTPPINVTCSPPSNTSFPLGTTTVACNGSDGVRKATCSFRVTLVPPQPVLSVLNYVAFGDSTTAGETIQGTRLVVDGANSYPMQLLGLLQGRYTSQTPQVHNCGLEGETAQSGAARIDSVLDFYKADVLLLLEGVNSLTGDFTKDGPVVQTALAHDISAAKARGMATTFLSTLLPEFPANCTPSTPTCRAVHNNTEIANINGIIYALAAQQNVPLVDNFTAFQGHPEYIDADGQHTLPLGNHIMAQQFLTAIQSKYEFLAPSRAQHASGASIMAVSPQCPHDGQTAVMGSR